MLPNLGSALPGVFGPLIIKGFGFDKFQTLLLNIPFGALQMIVIIFSCWVANRMKLKGVILLGAMLPVVTGCGMLYGLNRSASDQPALLVAYYIVAFCLRQILFFLRGLSEILLGRPRNLLRSRFTRPVHLQEPLLARFYSTRTRPQNIAQPLRVYLGCLLL